MKKKASVAIPLKTEAYSMLDLPSQLAAPFSVDGRVACKVLLDLTVYLAGPSESEFEFLLDLYDSYCPIDRRSKTQHSQ